jgi:hypothetical protein
MNHGFTAIVSPELKIVHSEEAHMGSTGCFRHMSLVKHNVPEAGSFSM